MIYRALASISIGLSSSALLLITAYFLDHLWLNRHDFPTSRMLRLGALCGLCALSIFWGIIYLTPR